MATLLTPDQLTLTELLTAKTVDELNAIILGVLQQNGFPTSDWVSGAVEKTLTKAFVTAVNDAVSALIPTIAGGGLVDYSTDNWLTLLSQQAYSLERNQASYTVGNMTLYCASGSGPYTISATQLWAIGAGGNRYSNLSGGTLRPPGFSSVTHAGAGTGTVTPSGTNTGGLSIVVKIIGSGGLGVGTFQWSADGGTTFGATTTIPGGAIYTDSASGIIITFAGTFTATDTYSFSSYGQLTLSWQSEFVNDSAASPPLNYTDASGSIATLVTPLPGVTILNGAPTYSAVSQIGTGTGTLGLTGTPSGTHQVTVRIDVSGASGAAVWSTSVDGAAYVSQGVASSISNLGGYGIGITLGGANPNFVAGDLYTFTTPGTWITTQGTDVEADLALQTRDKERWPDLGETPTEGVYDLMARAGSSQVTQTLVIQDPSINNKVHIIIAGQAGVLPNSVVTTVQAYINPRVPMTDRPVVESPGTLTITLGGFTVTVESAQIAAAKTSTQAVLNAYFNTLGINPTIRLAKIIELIMDISGLVDVSENTATINGIAGNLVLPQPNAVGVYQVASWTQLVANAFSWTAR